MLAAFLKKEGERFRYYDAITGMSEIMRRTFVNNSFDGALTMLGVLLGSFIVKINDPLIVVKLGIATAIAVGISGLAGALFAESAERRRQLKEMEKTLHRSLKETTYEKAHNYAIVLTALVDGISPFLTSLVILLPFFLLPQAEIILAYQASIVISMATFFLIGAFLGKVSGDSMIITGAKLVLTGFVCMLLIFLLEVI
jgi:predicted membrane protein (TIGR00267 family)